VADQQGRKDLGQDELLEALVPDPALRAPGYQVVKGWLGRSTHRGYWRLYPTPALDEYVEIAEDDIVLRRPVERSNAPLGGSVLVIKSTAEIHSMGSTSVIARDALLHGDITTELLGQSPADVQAIMIGSGLGDTSYTDGFWCSVSMLFSCTTHVVDNWVCTLASGKLCDTAHFLP
jgi:hypothetical protein